MAKVVYTGGVASFKGSIGGLTFQRNRSGSIVRLRPRTYKSVTIKQSDEIATFDNLKYYYQNLSQANIDLWADFADTYTKNDMWGTVKTLSGINWFCSINYYRILASNSILSAPPIYAAGLPVPVYSLLVTKNVLSIHFSPAWGTADDNLLIYTTVPVRNKTTSFRQYLRLTKIIDAGPFSSLDITSAWEATHGIDYPPGQSDPDFYIGIAVRSSKNSACVMSTTRSYIKKYSNINNGIGTMIIGSTFKIG